MNFKDGGIVEGRIELGIMNRGGSHHNVPDQQNDVFSKENMRHSIPTG